MAKCSISLNTTQALTLIEELAWSEFKGLLEDYYQGHAEAAPDLSVLIRSVNDQLIPEFFTNGFKPQDLLDFLSDPINGGALQVAVQNMFLETARVNTTAIETPDYASPLYSIMGDLVADAKSKIEGTQKDLDKEVIEEQLKDSSTDNLPTQQALYDRQHADKSSYQQDRFKASSVTETMFRTKFVRDFFLKAVYIDTDERKVVNRTQTPGQVSEIDSNLKTARVTLLKDMIERLNLQEVVNGKARPIPIDDTILETTRFNYILSTIEDKVVNPRYNNDDLNLVSDGTLFEISNQYRRTGDERLGEIINNYIDYVILADYNKILTYYFGNAISVNEHAGDFDPSLRKYNLADARSEESINNKWEEKVQDGTEMVAELYKVIINSTPILSYVTGLPMKDTLYLPLVSDAFAPYFARVDFMNGIQSIKALIIEGMNDPNNSFTSKNVLYTLYKNFFEEDGDIVPLHPNNIENDPINKKVRSILATTVTAEQTEAHPLMLLITKPLEEASKVFYAEALEAKRGRPAIAVASTNTNTITAALVAKRLTNQINRSEEELQAIFNEYDVKIPTNNGPDGTVYFKYEGQDMQLDTKASAKVTPAAIIALSDRLLGIDLLNDKNSPDKEFYEELKSLAPVGAMPTEYIQFIRGVLLAMNAKLDLAKPKVQQILSDGKGTKLTGNKIIDDMISRKEIKNAEYRDPSTITLTLGNTTARKIYDLITVSTNRYNGNRIKSTVMTLEGTTVAGFSLYNYFLGFKNNLQTAKRVNGSVVGNKISPITANPFLNDPNLLNSFYIRGAIKVGDKVKSNSDHSVLETLNYNINLGYFGNINKALVENREVQPLFDPTTYSDKTTNFMPSVNNTYKSPNKGSIDLFVNKRGEAVSEDVTLDLHFDSQASYYRNYANNIIDTWGAIFDAADAAGQLYGLSEVNTLSERLDLLNKINSKQIDGQPGFWYQDIHPYGLKGYKAARYYADKAGVHLTNWIHFQNNGKVLDEGKLSLATKQPFIDYVKLFDKGNNKQAFKKNLEAKMVQSANELLATGFKFEGDAIAAINKLYPDLGSEFSIESQPILKSRTAGKGPIKKSSDIHPAYRKYFYDWNFVSENILNSSLGNIYAHKGTSENNMWLTMTKRNVAAGASMRRYTLGLEQGVEYSTKTAFVDDITSMLKTIHGEEHLVVDWDGGALATMTQRMKTWHSLNSEHAGDGGIDHKPFNTHFDAKTGEVGINKFADFAMTNELIRASIGSDVDLLELHKELYSGDISKWDITKSWKDSINLSDFKELYRWDRNFDHANKRSGTIYKINGITYRGPNLNRVNQYDVSETNLTTGETTSRLVDIATFYDLWQVLGGIDSVSLSDNKTAISHADSTGSKVYYKPSHSSAEMLLNFESYVGNPGETYIPEEYIPARNSKDSAVYGVWKRMFGTNGVVSTQIEIMDSLLEGEFITQEFLDDAKIVINEDEFNDIFTANRADLQEFRNYITNETDDSFKWLNKPYQPVKGLNIERLTTAGAQKVGQFNMNDSSTYSSSRRRKALDDLGVTNSAIQQHADEYIAALDEEAYLGNRELNDDEKVIHQELADKFATLVNPAIPGVSSFITHQINNMNSGVQLSAFHETENSEVTLPTQMFNAFAFKGNSLFDVDEIYNAIADVVEEGLTDMFNDGNGAQAYNLPQLVKDLSDPEKLNMSKDKLLMVFKEIMARKVSNDEEFTLESVIVEAFAYDELPMDDSHIFNSAVAELTNYFTKKGIKVSFDGMFAVLSLGSGMHQLRDVKGGWLPIKTSDGGIRYKAITELTALGGEEYSNWKAFNQYVSESWDTSHEPEQDVETTLNWATNTSESPARELKGQQILLQGEDGNKIELSILRKGENHLIPEAEAVSDSLLLTDKYKSLIDGKAYGDLDAGDKYLALQEYWDDFKQLFQSIKDGKPTPTKYFIDGKALAGIDTARMMAFYDRFLQRVNSEFYNGANIDSPLDFLYENLSNSRTARDEKIARQEAEKDEYNWVLSHQYEFLDRINTVSKIFTFELQSFMQEATQGVIPESLTSEHYKGPKFDLSAKLQVSRGEVIAPVTMRNAFKLREGDLMGDIDYDFFVNRLLEETEYLNKDADAVMVSNKGKQIFFHKGAADGSVQESDRIIMIRGKRHFVDESKRSLFEVPRGVTISIEEGEVHVYLNNKSTIEQNPILRSIKFAFASEGESFNEVTNLEKSDEEKALDNEQRQSNIEERATEMYNSWNEYLNIIGTRIPGQHFQSFQGLRIIGFTEGNKIYVPNEVTLLSGSDFDIDKQNIIYYSITAKGTIQMWHPAANLSTPENLKESLQLPLPSKRQASAFASEVDETGRPLEKLVPAEQLEGLSGLARLNAVYRLINRGYKLHPELDAELVEQLVVFDNGGEDGTFKVPINGIKNFAISRANNIIESPANFLLLYKPVSMDTPKMFGDNSPKGEAAKLRVRENPVSVAEGKYDNMVGKKVIGIMAAGGLKSLSALTMTYNNSLVQLSHEIYKLKQVQASLAGVDPIKQADTHDKLMDRIATINDNIAYIQSGLLGKVTVPNIKYDNLEPEIVHYLELHPTGNKLAKLTKPDVSQMTDEELQEFFATGNESANSILNGSLEMLRIRAEFDEDAAELLSQLLSAATDNAKELILAKINATPDLAGIYASMIVANEPFEKIVDVMTSPAVEMLIRNGGRNIFNTKTKQNSLKNLIDSAKRIFDSKFEGYRKDNEDKLYEAYNVTTFGSAEEIFLRDETTQEVVKLDDLIALQLLFNKADDLRILSGYLGINQGIKSNSWALYAFKTNIEDYVNARVPGNRFDFKRFLDSVQSNDTYHKEMIVALSNILKETSNFNPLYVLVSTPNFAKQLVAYNSANTMLNISSYKINSVYNFVAKMRQMNYLSPQQNINDSKYKEIERYIDDVVIDNFITSEQQTNEDPHTRPIFYDGDKSMSISTSEGRLAFAEWVTGKFLPKVQGLFKGNEFIQDLLVDSKVDALFNDKFDFMHLTMDTTNSKSEQQMSYNDSYLYNLGLLYNSRNTDLQSDDLNKQNNVFNVLFWYNLIINRNNITKNSYAKLLGELMLRDPKSNPYRRLLELKGKLGKAEDVDLTHASDSTFTSNGINFDIFDMLANTQFHETTLVENGASESDYEYQEALNEAAATEGGDETEASYDATDTEGSTTEVADDFEWGEESGEVDEETGEIKRPRIIVERSKAIGKRGVTTTIWVGDPKKNGKVVFTNEGRPTIPFMVIPHSSQLRTKAMHIDYNPLVDNQLKVDEQDAVNYQRFLSMNIHTLLKNLSGDVQVKISVGGEPAVDFDPNKDYNCQ